MNKILYAGITLFICASCSNDNGQDIASLPDAKITLQVKASGSNKNSTLKSAQTKAGLTENELPGEANINNITAFVFSEDGSQLLAPTPFYQETAPASGTLTVPAIPAKAAKARIVLIGNAGSGTLMNINSYAELEATLSQLSAQSQQNLAMSSWVIETEDPLVAGNENYIGYSAMGDKNINKISTPLELTRLAARLDIVSLKTKFTRPELEGRTVKVESIAVANQKTASRFFSHDYWEAVVVAGNIGEGPVVTIDRDVDNNTLLDDVAFRTYVMENDGAEQPTELLITATISEKAPYLAETRTFKAVINEKGLATYKHNYVKRNFVYKISLTFNDDSFEGEDVLYGSVDITVTVAEWNREIIDIPSIDN